MATDISNTAHIKLLVDSFYSKVRKDHLLADIFNSRIADAWPQHLQKMYGFWQTVLLNEPAYSGSPFRPHASLPVDETHFSRWLSLFKETVDQHFKGEKATEAKERAEKMALMFQYKIQYLKTAGGASLL